MKGHGPGLSGCLDSPWYLQVTSYLLILVTAPPDSLGVTFVYLRKKSVSGCASSRLPETRGVGISDFGGAPYTVVPGYWIKFRVRRPFEGVDGGRTTGPGQGGERLVRMCETWFE